ncbi:MAG: YcxB family protein [Ruminococcaceae bacterium]|nr:YcxB family protein [Oscillospiraceae bacterium]
MSVNVNTVYSKERLLRFTKFVLAGKKPLWILMGICTLIVYSCFAVVEILGDADSTIWLCLILITLLDIIYLVFYLVVPRFTVNKAKNLDMTVSFEFTEENIRIHAQNELIKEEMTVKYATVTKVARMDNDVYLYSGPHQAFIVDISELSGKDITYIRSLLEKSVPQKKFKW